MNQDEAETDGARRYSHITEMTVFRMLDTLHPTATGLDRIPAWFLRFGALIFAAPLARLFDQSLTTDVVPHQWKTAVISPIPKTATPTQASDFRPISITPVLSRKLERFVVREYIYIRHYTLCRRSEMTSAGQCLYARILYSKIQLLILILISNNNSDFRFHDFGFEIIITS